MRYVYILLLGFAGYAAEWNDPTLPQARTDKPVYQSIVPGVLGVGGIYRKVRIPTTEDIRAQLEVEHQQRLQEIELAEIRRGSWMFLAGLIAAGIGFALHFLTAYPIAQRVSEWVLSGGLILAGIGLFVKKAAQYQNWIVLGVVVCIVAFALYKCKDWSISHLFKRTTTKEG